MRRMSADRADVQRHETLTPRAGLYPRIGHGQLPSNALARFEGPRTFAPAGDVVRVSPVASSAGSGMAQKSFGFLVAHSEEKHEPRDDSTSPLWWWMVLKH